MTALEALRAVARGLSRATASPRARLCVSGAALSVSIAVLGQVSDTRESVAELKPVVQALQDGYSGLADDVAELRAGLVEAKAAIERRVGILEHQAAQLEAWRESETASQRQRLEDYRTALQSWAELEAQERRALRRLQRRARGRASSTPPAARPDRSPPPR